MRELHRAVAIGAAITLLVGCSLLRGGAGGDLNGEWKLQAGTNQGQAVPIVPAATITLKINGTQVGGQAACNSYGGKLQVNGTSITISELVQTEMACVDENVMASEAAYLAALATVDRAERAGNSLVLRGPQVELRFALVPPVPDAALIGPVWVLESLIDGDVVSSTAAQATVQLQPDGKLTASTGCRTVTGSYSVSGSHVDVALDPFDTIGCADGVGEQDAQVLAVLGGGFEVAIAGDSMTLSDGQQGLGYRASARS